jgi:hypothetical protein
MARPVTVRDRLPRLFGSSEPKPTVVRDYGRDSLLVWANLLVAALFAASGRRVGLQSDEQLAARMEADAAAMRKQGYLVASVQEFSLPGLAGPTASARWYRVTYERAA